MARRAQPGRNLRRVQADHLQPPGSDLQGPGPGTKGRAMRLIPRIPARRILARAARRLLAHHNLPAALRDFEGWN